MTAIDKSEILKEIKLLKWVSDTAQDDLLNLTIKESIEQPTSSVMWQ